MKIVHCKIIGERQEGKCPICGRRISHGIGNGPRISHCLNCRDKCREYYIFSLDAPNAFVAQGYVFNEDMTEATFVG